MTDIFESETHYFLSILPSEKTRASNITPRTWNAESKRWVYQRNAKMYDSLMAEFGDELTEIKITRPPSVNDSVKTNNNIQDISKITEKLEIIDKKLSESNNASPDLTTQLIETKQEVIEYKRQIINLKKQLSDANEKIDTYEKQYQAIVHESQEHKSSAELSNSEDYIIQLIIQMAAIIPKNNSVFFKNLLHNQKINYELVKNMEIELKNILKKKLNIDDNSDITHDLIRMARDKGVINEYACDYAHTVRKQRNFLSHETVDGKDEERGRIIYTLFAFALMWKEIFSK